LDQKNAISDREKEKRIRELEQIANNNQSRRSREP